MNPEGQLRTVQGITYLLTRKKVRRFNLRVRADGSVVASIPQRSVLADADRFVGAHIAWIERARARLAAAPPPDPAASAVPSDEDCRAVFQPLVDHWVPLILPFMSAPPEIRLRLMKSRWGVCHPAKCTIVLNKLLLSYPHDAIEYVVVHELAHFLHPNHQAGFHLLMAQLLPDYKQRRAMLRHPNNNQKGFD